MPLFLDVHNMEVVFRPRTSPGRRQKDVAIKDVHGIDYKRYWVDGNRGKVFCLVEAPNAETAERVHRAAHGLIADEIYEAQEGG